MLLKADFNYEIPDELVAQEPANKRDASRLLVCHADKKSIDDKNFSDLPLILKKYFSLRKGSMQALFIINDTRVYPARVRIKRKTGGRGEVFLLEVGEKKTYQCLLRPLSKLKPDEILYSDHDGSPLFKVISTKPSLVSLIDPITIDEIFTKYGEMPLPPYINRDPKRVKSHAQQDITRYQTVYADANKTGSAAAPTAGLHFTPDIMQQCELAGVEFANVTLHVGLGTTAPVRTDEPRHHKMHEEYYCIPKETWNKINSYKEKNWPIVFVGTTSLRSVESFYRNSLTFMQENIDKWIPTQLFIYPENKQNKILPKVGNAILTNFHQPESTLVMLVAALTGYEFWRDFYSYAIEKKYRFFSYGDSSLLIFK